MHTSPFLLKISYTTVLVLDLRGVGRAHDLHPEHTANINRRRNSFSRYPSRRSGPPASPCDLLDICSAVFCRWR
ncbi:hypothetical protein BD309DRAFT_543001 [Dichomitus squalens]|nr:hypothetical protein BD309DRAFT_543001 [Dichomitus squalens]